MLLLGGYDPDAGHDPLGGAGGNSNLFFLPVPARPNGLGSVEFIS